jgi:hypothetical protein
MMSKLGITSASKYVPVLSSDCSGLMVLVERVNSV